MRRRIVYSGRVQGVGFRWNVSSVIADFKLTGYVKNLSDGTVEVLLEGNLREIEKGTLEIENKMKGYWLQRKFEDRKGEPHFSSFSIVE